MNASHSVHADRFILAVLFVKEVKYEGVESAPNREVKPEKSNYARNPKLCYHKNIIDFHLNNLITSRLKLV